MWKYILRRILLFVPTFFVISLLAFLISVKAPGDPVEILSGANSPQGGNSNQLISQSIKDSIRSQLGLDKPLFYFSLATLSDCDTLYKVPGKKQREILSRLTRQTGDWISVSNFYQRVRESKSIHETWSADSLISFYSLSPDTTFFQKYPKDQITEVHLSLGNLLHSLSHSPTLEEIQRKNDSIQSTLQRMPVFLSLKESMVNTERSINLMKNANKTWRNYIPSVHWFGTGNQYHNWLKGLLQGDFGYSYVDRKPISEKIWEKFFISFKLIFLSVLIAYLISIPVGVYSAKKRGGLFDRTSSVLLFMMYSLPSYFVGMLLLFFFANPDFMVWFPEAGYMDPNTYDAEAGFLSRFLQEWPYMVLPLITYTYSSLAYVSRIMRSSLLENLGQDYVRTARAKGLSESKVVWKHAFRNSLLPVITIFVNIFPLAIGGSLIIETIFTYPGMGLASYEAIRYYDYPAIVAIFSLSGLLTMIGYLIADVLYALVDPRISYER